MIRARVRVNFAWALRAIAKWFNARAEALDPVKISRSHVPALLSPSAPAPSRLFVASKTEAQQIIERARAQ